MHIRHTHSDEGFSEIDSPDHSPCEARCPTGLTPPRRTPIGETRRNHGRNLSHFVQVLSYPPLSSHSLRGSRFIACLIPPRGTSIEDFGWWRGIHTSTEGYTNPRASSVGLAQHLLILIATLAHAIWLVIPALFSYIGPLARSSHGFYHVIISRSYHLRPSIQSVWPFTHHLREKSCQWLSWKA